MTGGNAMGGGIPMHHSPSSSMSNFQQQSQQQRGVGGVRGGVMAPVGVGMNPMMGGGGSGSGGGMYDPFNNISGLQQTRGGQQAQQPHFIASIGSDQNNRSASNNRGAGHGF